MSAGRGLIVITRTDPWGAGRYDAHAACEISEACPWWLRGLREYVEARCDDHHREHDEGHWPNPGETYFGGRVWRKR